MDHRRIHQTLARRKCLALGRCDLPAYCDVLSQESNWAKRLSPAERQRLAFARVLLYRPDFLFLDEATSALDEATEYRFLKLLFAGLPDAAVIRVAHRSLLRPFFQQELEIIFRSFPTCDLLWLPA